MKIQFRLIVATILAAALSFPSCEPNGDNKNNSSLLALLGAGPSGPTGIATVTTTAIAGNLDFTQSITGTTATGGGNVTAEGDSTVTERGICWSTGTRPDKSGSHSADGSGPGVFTNALMTNLTADTTYHVRAYAVNNKGTAYGNEITFNSGKTIGANYNNIGYVFYNDGNGGGMIAAIESFESQLPWQVNVMRTGTFKVDFGTGQSNTEVIVGFDASGGYAAENCHALGGWFLPSVVELQLMYKNLYKNGYGGFSDAPYWSSSEFLEVSYENANSINFDVSEHSSPKNKKELLLVRCACEF